MSFLKIWNYLSSNGVKPEMSFIEINRIRIINRFCIVSVFITLFYTLLLLFLSAPILASIDFAMVLSGLISFYLTRKTNYKIAAIFAFITVPLELLLINIFWGRAGGEFYFIFLYLLAYYIFTQLKFLVPIIIYLTLFFVLARHSGFHAKPTDLTTFLSPYLYYINLICAFTIVSIFLKLFTDEHLIYQHQIEEKNQLLEKAIGESIEKNEKIKILLKELSHRTKNNLQLISSLINIQSSKITDISAKKALEESRNRIISIALVHKKLYQNDQSTTVSFKEYTKDLINYLTDTFDDINNPVKIEQDIDDFTINVDSAVTLGLLINELLTNSFKHGFKNSQAKFLKIVIRKISKNKLNICISDSGKGIEKIKESDTNLSFGSKLIHSLVEQMDGQLTINNKNENTINILLLLKD